MAHFAHPILVWCSRSGRTPKNFWMKLTPQKLEGWGYRAYYGNFIILLQPFSMIHPSDVTDKRTDGGAIGDSRVLRCKCNWNLLHTIQYTRKVILMRDTRKNNWNKIANIYFIIGTKTIHVKVTLLCDTCKSAWNNWSRPIFLLRWLLGLHEKIRKATVVCDTRKMSEITPENFSLSLLDQST